MRKGISEHSVVSMITNVESFERKVFNKKDFGYSFKFPCYLSNE